MRALILGCLLCGCGVVKNDTGMDAPPPQADAPTHAVTVAITPASPRTDDDLVATVTGAGTFTPRWSKNGTVRMDLAGETVDHLLTARGELWHIDVLDVGGTIVASTETTIVNTPPPAPAVKLNPNPPAPGVAITCMVTPGAADADGDMVTYSATWMKNGIPFPGATKTTYVGDTVPAASVKLGDTFQCTVAASDAIDMTLASTILIAAQCATGGSADFAVNGTFENGSIQSWVVPAGVCVVKIVAGGAHGGIGNTNGAMMSGTFDLTGIPSLKILVGQQAAAGALAGGGGTFVVTAANAPLLIAGGGGSNFSGTITDDELQGRIVTSGGTGPGGTRADLGNGGVAIYTTSGGGGGLLTNGANAGGFAFVNGGAGNLGSAEYHAGFGGGGNRSGLYGEGGGGGYSGGSCSNLNGTWAGCGGGGSFNKGTVQTNTVGANATDGYVHITW